MIFIKNKFQIAAICNFAGVFKRLFLPREQGTKLFFTL